MTFFLLVPPLRKPTATPSEADAAAIHAAGRAVVAVLAGAPVRFIRLEVPSAYVAVNWPDEMAWTDRYACCLAGGAAEQLFGIPRLARSEQRRTSDLAAAAAVLDEARLPARQRDALRHDAHKVVQSIITQRRRAIERFARQFSRDGYAAGGELALILRN